ncbi:MAG: hypothetical protein C0436_04660 [Alphaproteobacteria bacterium]|nr:hypothetical protein [Alphaproteobacteria bacterium]
MIHAQFYGQRLRTARNFHGLSLEEVGHKVAVSKQYLQQIESHPDKQPTEEMVAALADVLDVQPEFFFRPETNAVSDEECHFRKLQTTPVSTKNQALAHGTLFDELAERLDKLLSLPPVHFPPIPPKDMADIEHVAEACRIAWKLGVTGPIKNMVRVAENAGALITYFDGVSDKVDAFSMHRRRPLIIRNPEKESTCRLRFDIAHECGHLVMHAGIHTGDKKTEAEANRFASAFLLPRVSFLKEFPQGSRLSWKTIYDMKLRWKVSASAIVRRAYDLGLIDAALYRRANVHLRKTGEAKNEKYDDRHDLITPEEPELISNAFTALERKAPHKIHILLDDLGVKQQFLEKLINRKMELPDRPPIDPRSGKNILKFARK